MNKREAYETGKQYGYQAAVYMDPDELETGWEDEYDDLEDALTSAAYEAESNQRQFSPWEFVAHDINTSGDEWESEELWDEYERGVEVGVRKGIKQVLGGKSNPKGRRRGGRRDVGTLSKLNPRRRRGIHSESNPQDDLHAARELYLFINNDANLYRQMHTPINKNLVNKIAAGTYKKKLAHKAFVNLAEAGAKKYAHEFGGTWHVTFPPGVRRAVADTLLDDFEGAAMQGEYSHLLFKKYQKPAKKKKGKKSRKAKAKRNPSSFASKMAACRNRLRG